jgi:hypothetical protein
MASPSRKLLGAVLGALTSRDREPGDLELLVQLLAETLGKRRHLLEGANRCGPQMAHHLPGAVGGVADALEKGLQPSFRPF